MTKIFFIQSSAREIKRVAVHGDGTVEIEIDENDTLLIDTKPIDKAEQGCDNDQD